MKVLTLRLYSMFSRLDILAESFSWNLSDVQIYNSVLSFVCRTFSLPYHSLYRTTFGTFERDIIHSLNHYPRKIRKVVLQKMTTIFTTILRYPQYFEDILSNQDLCSSPISLGSSVAKSSSINYISYNLYVRFQSDSSTIIHKYGNISDKDIISILIRKKFLASLKKRVVSTILVY